MLRIWDCFLYEGRKVLYRFALGILKLYEKKTLQMSDTNNILGFLKRLPKHIFNADDLFYVSNYYVIVQKRDPSQTIFKPTSIYG